MAHKVFICLLAASVGIACGSTPTVDAKPTIAVGFRSCAVRGNLTSTVGTAPPKTILGNTCVGGAFDGGGNGTGIDVAIEIGGRETVTVTFTTAAANQTLAIEQPADPIDPQLGYLGAYVPNGVVWVRHSGTKAPYFAPARGSIAIGALTFTTGACAEACADGAATVELTFDRVTWDSPAGAVELSGKVTIDAVGGGEYCTKSDSCGAERACNRLDSNNGYCGPTNATGAELGASCSSSSACKSNDCDSFGQCSLRCDTNADCDASTVCVQNYRTFTKTCARPCSASSDCADLPSAAACAARGNADSTALVGACGGGAGTSTFGQPSSGGCDTALSIVSVAMGAVCTRMCKSNADCAAPLPTCGPREFVESSQTLSAHTSLQVCQ